MAREDQIAEQSNVGGLVNAALQIAAKRRETLRRLRAALVNSDTAAALKYARELCGLDHDETSN